MNTSQINKQIDSLTGLRFFAAFFVFISHGLHLGMPMQGDAPEWYNLLSSLSGIGMTLFFVLSGFVIHYNYATSIRNNPIIGTYNFFIARFSRLYPLFILGLTLDTIHHYGYSTLATSFDKILPYYITLSQSWFYFIINDHSLIYQLGHIPTVAWSVSTEWFFYMVYPAICLTIMTCKNIKSKITFSIMISILAYFIIIMLSNKEHQINLWAVIQFGDSANEATHYQDSFFRWLLYFSPYSRVFEFILGCITSAIYIDLSKNDSPKTNCMIGLITATTAIILVAGLHFITYSKLNFIQAIKFHAYIQKIYQSFGYAPFLALIIFCCARYDNIITNFFSRKIFVAGGDASYSLYLFHLVILEAFSRDAAFVTYNMPFKVYMADLIRLGIAFFATLGLSLVFYKAIEIPSRRLLRKYLHINNIRHTQETNTTI